MALRVGYFLAGTLVGVVLGTAVLISHADPAHAEVAAAADEAHVDVADLLGAMVSTGQADPFAYLRAVGELPPLQPPKPVLVGATGRADCIISKESGGVDKPNAQRSGADGPGQYFPSTWVRHTTLYRQATGYAGPLSLHSLLDVRRVMSWILAAIPSSRGEWSVGGC